jgi:formate hydrogenlyase transcriptional activator
MAANIMNVISMNGFGAKREFIGSDQGLRHVWKSIQMVARTDSAVLIQGETGTGKELVARAVHEDSLRKLRPFVTLNCAAVPAGLLESSLFGHERGAFTGAVAQTAGRFELAHRGTLFLDEIGDLPLELQPKLLRVLQEQEFERLGSTRTIHVDVRIVAATNQDLAQMVRERRFRADLFYRLNVFPIALPPLRKRVEDIPLLVRHFAQKFASRMHKDFGPISDEAMADLQRYDWPGNIRELQNVIERAVIMASGPELDIPYSEFAPSIKSEASMTAGTLEDIDRAHILNTLKQTGGMVGGRNGAAARLGLARTTLISRMRKLGIANERVREVRDTASRIGDDATGEEAPPRQQAASAGHA